MLWRAPWLRQRLVLIGMAAWDGLAIYLSYNITYQSRMGRWEGWSLGLTVLTGTWLGVSYLIGRYSPISTGAKSWVFRRLAEVAVTAFAVVAVFIGHTWIYQVIDAQTRFRGFLLPLVAGIAVASSVGQILTIRLQRKTRQWVLIGNEDEIKVIRHELGGITSRLASNTKTATFRDAESEMLAARNNGSGIAIGSVGSEGRRLTGYLLKERERGMPIIPMCNWCEQELHRIPTELITGEWLIEAEGFQLRAGSLSWRIKRFGDVLGASSLMLLTAPLVLVACVAIWLEDGGPFFYSQERTGLHGRAIKIIKLRSMRKDAEKYGAQWAQKGDPRITRIGNVLRRTRIDELPQLLSVIGGDLSLIGPRPERPEIEEVLEQLIPNYRVRHWIRPGLSGWAQVSYPYGASVEDSKRKLGYDIYYLRNAGLLLDVLILLKTIKLVMRGEGSTPNG